MSTTIETSVDVTQITTRKMLLAIIFHGTNEVRKIIARKVLAGESTSAIELRKEHGSFMNAILLGDFVTAFEIADEDGKKALQTLL